MISNFAIGYLSSIVAALTLGVYWKPLWMIISGVFAGIFRDLPRIGVTWSTAYVEPTETGTTEKMHEVVKLRQLGRLVWGEGTVVDTQERVFVYEGYIVRQTLCGSYWRKGSRLPTGRGVFQLLISGNDSKMSGSCIWHDSDTDKLENSKYEWTKRQSSSATVDNIKNVH